MAPATGRFVSVAIAALCSIAILTAIYVNPKQFLRLWTGDDGSGQPLNERSSFARGRQPAPLKLHLDNLQPADVVEQVKFRKRMLLVQAERKRRIAKVCSKLLAPGGGAVRGRVVSTMFNVPAPLRLSYCAIPKCSTTTWLKFFERVTERECAPKVPEHRCARRVFNIPSSVDDFLPISLVVVRNPWRRLVSAYQNKFVDERHGLAGHCYRRHGKRLNDPVPVTFAQFIRCLLEEYEKKGALNLHYAPQHWQCLLCRANYSYIAQLETTTDDFRYLATYVFPGGNYEAYRATFLSGHRRLSEVQNLTSTTYEDSYRSLEPTDAEALIRLFRLDAELLGYPLQPLT